MRRTAIALTLIALVAGLYGCAADAPTSPRPGPGTGGNALQINLVTNDANPKAGTCTLIEAIVTLNGNAVPDGTGVAFSTDFGSFSQSGLPLVSVVTQNGVAVTALCGPGAGTARVHASATVNGNSGSTNLTIVFQSDSGTLPFVASCSPSFGPKEGGTALTINGGRFFGSPATTRVQFTANGVTRDGIVQTVSASQVTVLTPGFPELNAPNTPAAISLTFGTNFASPVVLSLPSCFTFGTNFSGTPTIASILPSSGTNDGNTRVTIVGSGFSTSSGVQVFFGNVEATVVSVSFNQVVALSPAAFGAGAENLNATVQVTVRNIGSGAVSNGVAFRFTPAVQITGLSNGTQRTDVPFTPVTIFGHGFDAPVAVELAGVPAVVVSVSATEIVAMPSFPLLSGCANVSGPSHVTNLNTGDSAEGPDFTYIVPQLAITGISPASGSTGDSVTITGVNFPRTQADAEVKFGGRTAFVTALTPGSSVTVTVPPGSVTTSPTCTPPNVGGDLQQSEVVDVTVTDRATTCTATVAQAFTYLLPCVVPTPAP